MEQSATAESTLDRLAKKIEVKVAYYFKHRDQLYKPFLNVSLISYIVSIFWSLGTVSKYLPAMIEDSPKAVIWISASLTYQFVLILLAIAVKSRIARKKETAMTLFATFLFMNLWGFHVVLIALGLYAILNRSFRREAVAWSPSWYREICSALD